jgi:non-specific serine/threonine protein kinase
VARRVAGRFADGVWLAELAPVQDPALVAAVVAAALGVREQPGVAVAEVLARALGRQQLLLVLDNCEHVIESAAALCADLLPVADDVRVLATSREPLAVAGEARYRLVALTLPGPDEQAEGSEAVALFADRARRADARFVLDGEAMPAVARLVTGLDGMPLAIELAAARMEALGAAQLLDRLDERFTLLGGSDRMAPARQRSLAATVEWSYRLLGEDERRVFRWLSVFPAGFTLEAAGAVAGDAAGSAVLRLVDCSLLVPPRAGADGRVRYGMLETLRAYGRRLLDQDSELDEAAAALAGYALQVAQQASAGLYSSSGEPAAARWLDAEDATTRQVLAWAMEHDVALALRLTDALGWWWLLRGRLVGQAPLLRELASRAEPGTEGWCAAQFWLGWAALFSNDLAGTLDRFTELRDAVGDRGPSRALADALVGRSAALRELGRSAEAAEEGRRALAVARELEYPLGELLALGDLSFAASHFGDGDGAVRLARQAAQITAGVPASIVRWCSYLLTIVLIAAGDLGSAEAVCAAGLARSRDAGDLWNLASLQTRMVLLDLEAGRIKDAAAHLREALQLATRTGSWYELFDGLDCCGYLCAATGRPAEAITIWAAMAAHFSENIGPWPTDERRRELLRQAPQMLGAARARAAGERGAAMSLATAAEYALMLTSTGPQRPSAPRLGKLSAREQELVTLVAQGHTDAQIAAALYISVRTVRTHLDRIRDKTGCRRRADLTRLALHAGLI